MDCTKVIFFSVEEVTRASVCDSCCLEAVPAAIVAALLRYAPWCVESCRVTQRETKQLAKSQRIWRMY